MIVQHSFKNLAASANNAPNVMSYAQYKEKDNLYILKKLLMNKGIGNKNKKAVLCERPFIFVLSFFLTICLTKRVQAGIHKQLLKPI